MKLSICIPTHDSWKSDFGMSYGFLIAELATNPPVDGFDLELVARKSSLLPVQRHALAEQAIKNKATHILFLDTDMIFPRNVVHRLLKWNKPIVGANYSKKFPPFIHTSQGMDNKPCVTRADKTGLEPVKHMGMGVCLLETRIFESLPKPWFPIGWEPTKEQYFGEDVFFFQRCREHGFQPYVDHDVSKEVGHIGEFVYSTDLYEEIESDPAPPGEVDPKNAAKVRSWLADRSAA